MSKYQAYSEYKDSGIEWLGDIPSEWKLCRLKFMAKIKNGQDYKKVEVDDGYPVMGSGGQFTYASDFMYDKESVLLGRKGTIDKPLYIDEPFWSVDTMYYTEINNDISAKYFYYLALTIQFGRYSTNTALPSMTQENLGNFIFTVPNKTVERKKIANFLDHETAKIDTLIEKQQQLIKLLKEKRQAVISHAVTKGLNPSAPMRDSGVEWLGYVPEHWELSRIKYISELTPKKPAIERNLKCSFIPMEKLKTDSIILDETRIIDEVYDGYTYFKDADILMAKVTPCFENKNIAIAKNLVNSIGFGSSEIYVIRVKNEVSNRFLYYRLQEDSFMDIAIAAMTGSGGLKRVPSDVLNNYTAALPDINEQQKIANFLDHETAKIDALIGKQQQLIKLLKEKRQAVISHAVTGKIDVRNWQSPEPTNTHKSHNREAAA